MSNVNDRLVTLGVEYYPDPASGKPIALGYIYVGIPDTDPEVVENQKQVTLRQEDGILVEVSQPVRTGAGGVPVYNGSPAQIFVNGDYSLKVLDKDQAQVYYFPDASIAVITQRDEQTATEDQTVFTLTGDISYIQGANNVAVYIDGRRQFSEAYEETSTTSITFSEGLAAGQVVLFSVNDAVPIGSGVESGSNSNGWYTKWSDGTMICTHALFMDASNQAVGSLFKSSTSIWTYPVAFSTSPVVSASVRTNLTNGWVARGALAQTATQAGFNVLSPVTSAATPNIGVTAIGRWK